MVFDSYLTKEQKALVYDMLYFQDEWMVAERKID